MVLAKRGSAVRLFVGFMGREMEFIVTKLPPEVRLHGRKDGFVVLFLANAT